MESRQHFHRRPPRRRAPPLVEVALLEHGNNNLPVGNHYIRQVQPLTRELDEVSKQIKALTTRGGEEYCDAAIQRAITDLTWDQDPKTYKAIFIVGNEPFPPRPGRSTPDLQRQLRERSHHQHHPLWSARFRHLGIMA